jgi:hypothetical protein
MGEAAIIAWRASWLFRIGQRWGHNLPHESIDGRGRDAVGEQCPAPYVASAAPAKKRA